jgi:6-phosphogluconolactonase
VTVFIGTYTTGASHGIYRCTLDPATGQLRDCALAAVTPQPSFLRVDARHRVLHAVNEVGDADSTAGGALTSFRINDEGRLTPLARQPTCGASPCFVAVDEHHHLLLTANYDSGSVTMCRLTVDGAVGSPCDVVTHTGRGPDPRRQTQPHPHSVHLSPDGQCVLVVDLGLDRIVTYAIRDDRPAFETHALSSVAAPPGSGPRHAEFHPDGRHLYVVNELGSSVTVYAYRDADASLSSRGTWSTLPAGWHGQNKGGDLHVAPSGNVLYVSNRGHDSIAIFDVVYQGRALVLRGHVSTQGRGPRQFVVTPEGTHLLVANQDSDRVASLAIDPASGALAPTGSGVAVPTPACVACAPWLD